jgi:hypothetical protein
MTYKSTAMRPISLFEIGRPAAPRDVPELYKGRQHVESGGIRVGDILPDR